MLYAVAQGIERNMQQTRREMVRDADPHRDPMHGGDRRETIGRVIDGLMLDEAARDELNVAANPVLETVDDDATYIEATQRAEQ